MFAFSWLRQLQCRWFPPKRVQRRPTRQRPRFRPRLEALEDRTLLSAVIATTTSQLIGDIVAANNGTGATTIQLQAANTANGFDFTAAYNATENALPQITANITIEGSSGYNNTIQRSTVSGTPAFRLFDVASGGSLTLENLSLAGGLVQSSIAISSTGVPSNVAAGEGGGIYSSGTLTLSGVTVKSNNAVGANNPGPNFPPFSKAFPNGTFPEGGSIRNSLSGGNARGGGLYVAAGTVTLSNDTLSGNHATGGNGDSAQNHIYGSVASTLNVRYPGGVGGNGFGGGLYVATGTVTLSNDTLSSNKATGGNGGNGLIEALIGGVGSGGGLYVAGGTVTLSNDTLSGNNAQGGGGGNGLTTDVIAISGGPGGVGGVGSGGGLYMAAGSVTLSNDTLSGNNAQGGGGGNGIQGGGSGGGGSGGGMYVAGGTATLSIDTLSGNKATGGKAGNGLYDGFGGDGGVGSGGGLCVTAGTVALSNDTLSGNNAQGGYGGNGGFKNGEAGSGGNGFGGGLYVAVGTATLSNDTLNGNNAQGGYGGNGSDAGFGGGGGTGLGGGLYIVGAAVTLNNDTLSGNNAQGGHGGNGGFGNPGGGGTIPTGGGGTAPIQTGETYEPPGSGGNGGNGSGGGIYLVTGSTTILANTLIAQNTVQGGAGGNAGGAGASSGSLGSASDPDVSGTVSSSDHDLIGDGSGSNLSNGTNGDQVGTSTSPIDPLLGPLANNGGPTQTMALLPGSPAINAGDNNVPNLPAYDQRGLGYARISGGTVDIGAFEVQSVALSTTTAVTTSASPSTYGNSVIFTAKVTSTSTPTGSVKFVIDGGTPVAGTAGSTTGTTATWTYTTSTLGAGTHTVEALYTATGNFGNSNGTLSGGQTVNKANATVVVAPYTVTYDGNTHTATYTITGVNGQTGAAVGTVTLNTTHTDAGSYTSDSWSFTATANYNNIASTTITDVINPVDVRSDATIQSGGFIHNFALHGFVQTLTITANTDLSGPLALELLGLSGATLASATVNGVSVAIGTDSNTGNPYLDLTTAAALLQAGQSLSVVLYFKDPTFQRITYGTEILQGLS